MREGEVEVQLEAQVARHVQLAFNENPAQVSEKIKAGIDLGANTINRYPFAIEERVMQKLARHFRCPQDNLMLVRGIDECFDRVSAEFPQMRYVTALPGFDGLRRPD